jgi:hypothetical protein
LQSPRTKYSIAWLEIFRPVKRHYHIWRTSMILPKTSHQCDARKEDMQICTSQLFFVSPTTLQLHPQPPSSFCWNESQGEWRHQQLWPTMTLGWIGLTPNIVLLGIVGTWSTSCDFCNCLLFALGVLDSVCSCLECFLSVYCYLVLVLVFGLSALKTIYRVKPWVENLFKVWFSRIYFVSLSSIDNLLVKH